MATNEETIDVHEGCRVGENPCSPQHSQHAASHRIAPVKLGNIDVPTPVVLSPMAGVTNWPFRVLCEQYGPSGLYVAEMITARALATLDRIIEVGGHLLAPGGRLLAMKAGTVAEEAANLPTGWRLEGAHELVVPGLAATRQLAVVARAG